MNVTEPKQSFTFFQIQDAEQMQIINRLARSWQSTADRLAALAKEQNLPETELYESSWMIATLLLGNLSEQNVAIKDTIICIDDKNEIQGCMQGAPSQNFPNGYEIELVMKNPLKIRSHITRNIDQTHQVLNGFVIVAIQRCLARHLSQVVALPFKTAIENYRHLGFTESDKIAHLEKKYMILNQPQFAPFLFHHRSV
jgi:hypothetical protein